MQQLLGAFVEFGHQVTFASTAGKTPYSLELGPLGVASVPIQMNHPGFDGFVRATAPDMVIFDRFMVEEQFSWRVAEQAPDALRILNTEDLHSLRKARESAHVSSEGFSLGHWRDHPVTLRELASIHRCDLSLMVSPFEMDFLEREAGMPGSRLLYLPFMVEPLDGDAVKAWPLFGDRRDFVCIGNGKHAPNVDALRLLKKAIWPLIRREMPQAVLHVHGAYLPREVLGMHDSPTGFMVEGWADDLTSVLHGARLLLAPLQFGAGIKGKLLDAMYHGTPSVTTPLGAEGMKGELPWGGAIAEAPGAFARAAVELYNDKEQWERAQAQGLALVNTRYGKNDLQARLDRRLAQIQGNLKAHRRENIIGRILMDQIHASHKYMAKWIQEKHGLG